MTRSPAPSSTRRARLLTSAAVGGALLAGTVAVAANIGILNAADNDAIGTLSAANAAPAPSVEPQVIDIYLDDPATLTTSATTIAAPATSAPPASAEFVVADAGVVSVVRSGDTIVVDDVVAEPGYLWEIEQLSDSSLTVRFASNDTTYVFYVDIGPDGDLTARVDQPIVQVVRVPNSSAPAPTVAPAPVPTAAPATTPRYDDDGDDDEYEDHDDEDHDDEDDDADEYDDHDDEDHDEREGSDDDD